MNQERTVCLFSYGTLQLVSVQTALFGRILEGRPDSMPGFRQTMIEMTNPEVIAKSGTASHPIVTHTGDPTDRIEGTAFLITEDEPVSADTYEVSDYVRVRVRLQSGADAWVYVAA
jgi:hypothetical protein